MMGRPLGVAILLLVAVGSCALASADAGIVNTKVDRKVDLATQTVRIQSSIKFENQGKSPVQSYLVALPPSDARHLAFIGATQGKGRSQVTLEVHPASSPSGTPPGVEVYEVKLARPIAGGESGSLEVLTVHTEAEVPFPAEITQSEEQLVVYAGSVHLVSPYPTAMQSTKVLLPTSLVKAYTKAEPVKKAGTEINYGAYTDVAPFTVEDLKVHFENNSQFAVVDELVREVEVSHWGNVYVTEQYKMRNAGAKHKGSFSRFEYQGRPHQSGQNAVRELLARLPPRAYSVYYRDEIGNISSSHLRSNIRNTELQLEPRYPLLGGWRTEFTVGYSLPLPDFLSRTKDGRRLLNVTFGCPLRDVVVNHLLVKVILPEGSRDSHAAVPFAVKESTDVRYTYLDTVGRPVLVLQKDRVVMEHNQHFQVSYRFSPLALLAEPLLLVAFFALLFLAAMLALRLDLTIAKSSAAYQADLHRDKVRDLLVRLSTLVATRGTEGDKVEASLKELSRSGDVAAARAAKRAVDSSLKDSARQLKALQDELDAAGDPKAAAKASAVATKEREKLAAQAQVHETAVAVWEKKLAAKDGEQRMAALHQRIKALKQDLRELSLQLEN